MARKAFLKLLEQKALMTVNAPALVGNPLDRLRPLTLDGQVEFIWERLKRHRATRGYNREYIRQLLLEEQEESNLRRDKARAISPRRRGTE